MQSPVPIARYDNEDEIKTLNFQLQDESTIQEKHSSGGPNNRDSVVKFRSNYEDSLYMSVNANTNELTGRGADKDSIEKL